MGWTYIQGYDKADIVRELTQPDSIKVSCVGNHLWQVREHLNDDGTTERYIVLSLLSNDDGGWGHKDMTEDMGPNYYDCPLSLLKMVPCPDSPYAREWRRKVREHHDRKNALSRMSKSIEVGDIVFFKKRSIPYAEIVSTTGYGRRGTTRSLTGKYNGQKYRVRPGIIERVEKPIIKEQAS